jgi:hypothetical protein
MLSLTLTGAEDKHLVLQGFKKADIAKLSDRQAVDLADAYYNGDSSVVSDGKKIVIQIAAAAVVRFGNNLNQDEHTFRHVEEAGIDKQAAEKAIREDLAGKEDSLPQGLTKGSVNVGGKTLEYNAYKLPDGTINVGRITVH